MVALVLIGVEVEISILIADFQQSQSEGLRMSVLCAQGSPLGGLGVAVGVLDGIQRFLDVFLQLVVGLHPAVAQSHIDHEERFCPQVLGELQHLVVAEAVGDVVAPVNAQMTGSLFDRADGVLPLKAIVQVVARGCLSLDIAAAGETHELGMQGFQQLGQIDAASVLATLVGGREERDDIHRQHAGGGERQRQATFGVAARRAHGYIFYLGPSSSLQLEGNRGLTQVAPVGTTEGDDEVTLVGSIGLHPGREGVVRLLAESHTPVAFVLDTAAQPLQVQAQGVGLTVVKHPVGRQRSHGTTECFPMHRAFGVVLERTVLNQFGVEAAITGMIDFLEENAIEAGANLCPKMFGIHSDHRLRHGPRGCKRQGYEPCATKEFESHVCVSFLLE